jgi:ABC-2 type transport system ATP-binding protein
VCDRPVEAMQALAALPVGKAAFFGDRLHMLVEDAQSARAEIVARLTRAGHLVRRVERVPLSIEDVFIAFIEMEQARTETVARRQVA